jgi:hypothetical protein
MLLAVGINVGVIAGDIIEQHRRPFLAHYERGRYVPLIELSRRMDGVVGERDLVIAQEDRVVSYFGRRKTLPPITARRWEAPDAEVRAYRDELSAAGQVFVLLPGDKVEQLIRQWDVEVDPVPVLSAEGPLMRSNKTARYSLHRATIPPAGPPAPDQAAGAAAAAPAR